MLYGIIMRTKEEEYGDHEEMDNEGDEGSYGYENKVIMRMKLNIVMEIMHMWAMHK